MSDIQYIQLEPRHGRAWHMYRAMVGIGLICAIIIVSVFQATYPVIKQNKLELLQQSLYRLFPAARQFSRYQYRTDGSFQRITHDTSDNVIYAMYDQRSRLLGIAIPASGMGYQDLIEMLYGYNPDKQIVNGYQILASRETPGLGSKIETDKSFRKKLSHLDVTVNVSDYTLRHPVEVVNNGDNARDWQIDTITGATISSRTVGRMVANSTAQWIPKIKARLEDFQQ